jgi:hypothetical protein
LFSSSVHWPRPIIGLCGMFESVAEPRPEGSAVNW